MDHLVQLLPKFSQLHLGGAVTFMYATKKNLFPKLHLPHLNGSQCYCFAKSKLNAPFFHFTLHSNNPHFGSRVKLLTFKYPMTIAFPKAIFLTSQLPPQDDFPT